MRCYSAARSNVKKVSLELGGKSPLIIFSDCDIDRAVRFVSMNLNRFSPQELRLLELCGCLWGLVLVLQGVSCVTCHMGSHGVT